MPRILWAVDSAGMHQLLELLDTQRNHCLIGAGVSHPLVPMGAALGQAVEAKWLSQGGFHVVPPERGPLFQALGLGSRHRPDDIHRGLLLYIKEDAIKNILYLLFRRPLDLPPPDGYRLFLRLPRPLSISNMNVDGLALRLVRRGIRVRNLHGSVRENVNWASPDNVELADELIELGIPFPQNGELWFPQPEPAGVTEMTAYREVRATLRNAANLVLIGYSFGASDTSVNDSETLAFFAEGVRSRSLPVSVLDTSPDAKVDLVGAASGTARLTGITVNWGALCTAALSLTPPRPRLLRSNADEILRRYRRLVEHLPGSSR